MKKEVTVCDGNEGRCRTLAERACPLCEKDFCSVHFRPTLFVQLCVRQPGTPQPGQGPFAPGQEKFDMQNVQEVQIGICDGCYFDLSRAQFGPPPRSERRQMLEPLATELKPKMIETCRAALATYKLENSEK